LIRSYLEVRPVVFAFRLDVHGNHDPFEDLVGKRFSLFDIYLFELFVVNGLGSSNPLLADGLEVFLFCLDVMLQLLLSLHALLCGEKSIELLFCLINLMRQLTKQRPTLLCLSSHSERILESFYLNWWMLLRKFSSLFDCDQSIDTCLVARSFS